LADRLDSPSSVSGCDSSNPSNCTLQKAYCGQTCAADPTCGTSCIDTFRSHAFDDAATFTWGSCTVTIRCVAPNG